MHFSLLGWLFFCWIKNTKQKQQNYTKMPIYKNTGTIIVFLISEIIFSMIGVVQIPGVLLYESWTRTLITWPNHVPMKIKSLVSFTGKCVMCMTLTRDQDIYGKKKDWSGSLSTCMKYMRSLFSPVGRARTSNRNMTLKNNPMPQNTENCPFLSAKKNRL